MTEIINCPYCDSPVAIPFRTNADIVQCMPCGLVYLRTRPTADSMYEIYQRYANDTSHMKPPASIEEANRHGLRRETFVNQICDLPEINKGGWLDIGCGWGALLNYTRELGFSPKGIEMTRNCLDFATMQLEIPVSNAQFTDSAINENSFNVVSMVHVLEHIPNPKETVAKIYNTLVPGGVFCGIVPNIDSFCSKLLKEHWVWLDPTHHYVHYSPTTLREKLEEAGFQIEKISTAIGDYDYTEFLNRVKQTFGLTDNNQILEKAQSLESNGGGEEIRFFVRK
jgi:2-polyprenyl-3-methyl-5-hydroxy-6-metoxy-1,4-benzoquinol methylase